MTIRVALHHETRYQYDRPIALGPQLIRLRPAYHCRTKIVSYDLDVRPKDQFINWQQDPFANPVARLVFPKRAEELSIVVDLVADMTVINPFDFFVEDSAESWPFQYNDSIKVQLAPYLVTEPLTPKFGEWVDQLPKASERVIDFLVNVNRMAQQSVNYTVRLEPGVQTPEETLTLGSGSCRDSAWMLVQAFRQIGMAARFVSGYLIQLAPDIKPIDGPTGPVEDFCDLHAWTEVYLPGAGWVGLDPTSGLMAGEGHIPLACTPHYADAAPITGGHEACEVQFSHLMTVSRVQEGPRTTKPYTEAQWSKILSAGQRVDESLQANDVRLTMGGEPTFVAIDNADDPQWNTEAVGIDKRVLSNLLLLKLRDNVAPGAMLHYGQGKWYPGESLPRWALTCLWRRDGQPVWQNPKYIADEGTDYGYTHDDAQRFVQHLAGALGIEAKLTFPVYEDTFHYLWRENRLPIDVDPTDPKLEDPNERAMMVRTFTQGLNKPVGFVMPLRRAWWQAHAGWVGGRWPVRGNKVFVIPGDSPIGLRLPLDSLPATYGPSRTDYLPVDPFAPRGPLPEVQTIQQDKNRIEEIEERLSRQDDREPDGEVIPTALCVECRFGRLHVFMPPTQRLEDYLDLVAAIEETCADLEIPVVLEGYLPPPDHRVEMFKVTPDPGVIEVNVQPSATWRDLVELTETLYDQARQSRLTAEKFDIDGTHTGTGGGAHIVLGGRTPIDSPFIRRPDLLASMIRFWHNHPALSYLFSGKFIGPTSQAPRMDEARRDSVNEMEISLGEMEKFYTSGHEIMPWTVDRLFRDLMVDLTGNTHRAEICIDKLYSPDSSTGRLGLVELRGFEMPPSPRMNLAQQLLIRSIVAAFWNRPYKEPLTRWGTSLYDRFLLPHFVWHDLGDLLDVLARHGVDLQQEWFLPHYEFRFPKIGEVRLDDLQMEVRSAIEPWYLMGEEPAGGGTARFVDSSMERLQITVDNFDPRRYAVLCNGRRVPMHASEISGRYIAGIKFRAWQPPRCLHPTIGINVPLQFDVVDRATEYSLGGCRYFAADPSGRSHEVFPINSNEAESRRAARFHVNTMTGGRMMIPELPPVDAPNDFPITFDMRRS
ncbi:transglutaminase family protein [Roseiconus nitratireducens]|uniref:Transglutaminase family protein n=1 Tax=Roseiconus nitratireducens TaxID=2605748 RepID=A0A5M6DE39_9BACT|nr:transglutaminase family protein [Roseiconus nitratireducens]KAA5544409.1 transglutaminase family protein [Roseiconus nitratireducens]